VVQIYMFHQEALCNKLVVEIENEEKGVVLKLLDEVVGAEEVLKAEEVVEVEADEVVEAVK